jgi:hypothetical protein
MLLSEFAVGSFLLSAFVAQDVTAFVPTAAQYMYKGKQLSQSAPSSTSLFNEYIQTSVSPIQTVGGKNKKKASKIEASEMEGPSVFESYQPPEAEAKSEEPVPGVNESLETESPGEAPPDVASAPASETAPVDEDAD